MDKRYDLACGKHKQEGYIGVDISSDCDADIIYDLNQFPWEFGENNSAEIIFVSHYIEHIPMLLTPQGKDYLCAFMDESYRILKVGGKLTIIAPYYSSMRAFQDPTHRRFITDATFCYFNKKWREEQRLDYYNIDCDFDFNLGYFFMPDWDLRNEEAKMGGMRLYNNVVADIQATLTKRDPNE